MIQIKDLRKHHRRMSAEELSKYLKKAGVSDKDYKDWDRQEEQKIKEAKKRLSKVNRSKKGVRAKNTQPEAVKSPKSQEDTVDSAKGKPVAEYKESLEKFTRSKQNGPK